MTRWIAAVLAACLLTGCGDPGDAAPESGKQQTTIQNRLETLFDAAQNGDVERYLNCFAGSLRSAREKQLGANAGSQLRAAEAKLNGFVIVERHPNGDDSADVVIDKVYPEFQERWRVTLRRDDGDWKITAMQPVKKAAPKTKFGTPVVPELPSDDKPRQ